MARFYNYATSLLGSVGDGAQLRAFQANLSGISAQARSRIGPLADMEGGLRELAIAIDRSTSEQVSLALLWRELKQGVSKVVDCFFTADRYFVMTRATPGASRRPNRQRQRILQAVLAGGAQKIVAMDLRIAPSTVTSNAHQALVELGIETTPSRTHPLLVMAAKADHLSDDTLQASSLFFTLGNRTIRVVSMPRPEQHFCHDLSCAEFEVMQRLIEGECYATIAQQRGTSERTVANQIASVFRKLRVSGRAELLLRLVEQPSEGPIVLEKSRASH